MVGERQFTTEINRLVERKVQAATHRASCASAVVNSARFTSFVGVFIGGGERSSLV